MEDQQKSSNTTIFDSLKTDTTLREFFDIRKSSIPVTYEMAKSRVESNLVRFKMYYLGLTLIFMAVFAILRPSFLIFICIGILSYYLHHNKLTIRGHKLDSTAINISTGVCLLICGIVFINTLVSILALLSLTSITILSHAVVLDKVEDKEIGV